MGRGDASVMATQAIDPKALARVKLMERRRHVRRLRLRVVATAVVVFVALWGVIFVRLVTGHDPALTASAKSAAVTSSGTGASSGSSTGSGSTTSSANSGTTSVTTRSS